MACTLGGETSLSDLTQDWFLIGDEEKKIPFLEWPLLNMLPDYTYELIYFQELGINSSFLLSTNDGNFKWSQLLNITILIFKRCIDIGSLSW